MLASGNFNILTTDVPIQIPSGIVLRGTGSCTKSSSPYCDTSITVYDGILAYTGGMCGTSLPGSGCPNGGQPMVQMGPIRIDYGYSWAQCGNVGGPHPNALSCGAVSLAADAAQGATTIQVTQTSGFSVGDWTLIDEASGAGWVTDPMDAWTGFGQVWAASDWLSSSGSPATGRVLWSKSLNAPGWDFGAYYVTGGISGTTFTTAPQNVGIALYSVLSGTGVTTDTLITANNGDGTYVVTPSQSVSGGTNILVNSFPFTFSSAGCAYSYCDRVTNEIHYISAIGAGPCPGVNCTLTFDSPLTIAYRQGGSHAAQVYPKLYSNQSGTGSPISFAQNVGLENISLLRPATGGVELEFCAYCWLKNVEVGYWYAGGINIKFSARSELNSVFVHHCADSVNSGGEYPIDLALASTEILINNSQTLFGGKGMTARAGGAGSVVAYNYQDDTMYDNMSGINDYWVDAGLNASHFSGPHHVLFEGNFGDNLESDDTHGNAVYHTFFRNWSTAVRTAFADPSLPGATVDDANGVGYALTANITSGSITGTTLTVTSLSAPIYQGAILVGTGVASGTTLGTQISGTTNGVGTYNVTPSQTVSSGTFMGAYNVLTPKPLRAAGPQAYNYWFAFIGNVFGKAGVTTSGNRWTYTATDFTTKKLIMPGWNAGPGGVDPYLDGTYGTYVLFTGNYDYVNAAVTWAGSNRTIPNSLYLSSPPAFFSGGASCTYTWPWITPTSSPYVQANSCSGSGLPAKARWDAGTPFVQP